MTTTIDTPHAPTEAELADIFRPVPASEHVASASAAALANRTPAPDYADVIADRALDLFGKHPEDVVILSGAEYRDNLAAAIREGYGLGLGTAGALR